MISSRPDRFLRFHSSKCTVAMTHFISKVIYYEILGFATKNFHYRCGKPYKHIHTVLIDEVEGYRFNFGVGTSFFFPFSLSLLLIFSSHDQVELQRILSTTINGSFHRGSSATMSGSGSFSSEHHHHTDTDDAPNPVYSSIPESQWPTTNTRTTNYNNR